MTSAIAQATEEHVVVHRAPRVREDLLLDAIEDSAIRLLVEQAIARAKERQAAERIGVDRNAWKLALMDAVTMAADSLAIPEGAEKAFNLTIQYRDGHRVGLSLSKPRIAGAPRKSKSGDTLAAKFGARDKVPVGTHVSHGDFHGQLTDKGWQIDGRAEVYASPTALAKSVNGGSSVNGMEFWTVS